MWILVARYSGGERVALTGAPSPGKKTGRVPPGDTRPV